MYSRVFFDLSRIDPSRVEIPIEEIRRYNPHRYEFEQIDGIFCILPQEGFIVGYKDVRPDEFWVRGHIPGMPILPGVLMIEAAAQLCSVYQAHVCPTRHFFGFGGVDAVKFRAPVRPGERLVIIGRAVQVTSRRSVFDTQGVVGERFVFEGRITGVVIPHPGLAQPGSK